MIHHFFLEFFTTSRDIMKCSVSGCWVFYVGKIRKWIRENKSNTQPARQCLHKLICTISHLIWLIMTIFRHRTSSSRSSWELEFPWRNTWWMKAKLNMTWFVIRTQIASSNSCHRLPAFPPTTSYHSLVHCIVPKRRWPGFSSKRVCINCYRWFFNMTNITFRDPTASSESGG